MEKMTSLPVLPLYSFSPLSSPSPPPLRPAYGKDYILTCLAIVLNLSTFLSKSSTSPSSLWKRLHPYLSCHCTHSLYFPLQVLHLSVQPMEKITSLPVLPLYSISPLSSLSPPPLRPAYGKDYILTCLAIVLNLSTFLSKSSTSPSSLWKRLHPYLSCHCTQSLHFPL